MQEKTLSGTIERVTFHNEENGYCVLRVRANARLNVICGIIAPNAGEDIAARGNGLRMINIQFKADEISTSEQVILQVLNVILVVAQLTELDLVMPKIVKNLAQVFNIIDDDQKA